MAFFIGAPTCSGIWPRIEAGMVQMHHCAVAVCGAPPCLLSV